MKHKILTFFTLLILSMFQIYAKESSPPKQNSIRLKNKAVIITFENNTEIPTDSFEITIETCPIFIDSYENKSFPLKYRNSDGSFIGNVTTERNFEVAFIKLTSPEFSRYSPILLDSPNILRIDIKLNKSENDYQITTDNNSGLTRENVDEINNIIFNAWEILKTTSVPSEKYKDWKDVRSYELEKILPQISNPLNESQLPDSLKYILKTYLDISFAQQRYIPYTAVAKDKNDIIVDEPPMEAYNWLNHINMDYLLDYLPMRGIKNFLSCLLRFPEGGLEPIGEAPVAKWQEYAAIKLKPAIENPSGLLSDLLASTSYILQLEKTQKELSDIQIKNIKEGFDPDLGELILNENEIFLINTQKSGQIIDLTGRSFDLREFINQNYKGKPVVVDTWNTWCAPCIDAITSINQYLPHQDNDVIFLYISDTSSSYDSWFKKLSIIPGINIRINKEDSQKLGEQFGLQGFPSYIFFNKKHEVASVFTGFPGWEIYKSILNEIR